MRKICIVLVSLLFFAAVSSSAAESCFSSCQKHCLDSSNELEVCIIRCGCYCNPDCADSLRTVVMRKHEQSFLAAEE